MMYLLSSCTPDLNGLINFVYTQLNIPFDNASICIGELLQDREIKFTKCSLPKLKLNGDVQLIKIPDDQVQHFMSLYKDLKKIAKRVIDFTPKSMEEVVLAMDGQGCVTVIKPTAFDIPQFGSMNRTCHIKELQLNVDYFSPQTGVRKGVGKPLFNQFLIYSTKAFGISGDSGSMIFVQHENGTSCNPIGIFVGTLSDNAPCCFFIATPFDYVVENGYKIFVKD
jgi:hypothetical protein